MVVKVEGQHQLLPGQAIGFTKMARCGRSEDERGQKGTCAICETVKRYKMSSTIAYNFTENRYNDRGELVKFMVLVYTPPVMAFGGAL
jgi:hypothetical protein